MGTFGPFKQLCRLTTYVPIIHHLALFSVSAAALLAPYALTTLQRYPSMISDKIQAHTHQSFYHRTILRKSTGSITHGRQT